MQSSATQHIATQKIRPPQARAPPLVPRVFTFVNKKTSFPHPLLRSKNREKRVGFTQKRVFLRGSETASGEGKTGARQSLWLIEALFSLYLLLMSSCQIVLNIIKISNKSSFVQTLFIIFAVFNRIEHDHIIEQAKKNEGK